MIKFEDSEFYKLIQDFFINNDKKTFIQFLAEFYNRTQGIIDKNDLQDEIIKELSEEKFNLMMDNINKIIAQTVKEDYK